MPYYRKLYGYKPDDFPNAMRAYETIFSLPIYPDLSDGQVDRVVHAVLDVGSSHLRS
jgi:dTDP-4-amino-4,6-dideoxygalactose transaminase